MEQNKLHTELFLKDNFVKQVQMYGDTYMHDLQTRSSSTGVEYDTDTYMHDFSQSKAKRYDTSLGQLCQAQTQIQLEIGLARLSLR